MACDRSVSAQSLKTRAEALCLLSHTPAPFAITEGASYGRELAGSYCESSKGHTSTTPCATAQGVCDAISTASASVGASMTANPATGSAEDMKGPSSVPTVAVMVADLHRPTGSTHFDSGAAKSRIVRVRGVPDGQVGLVVASLIAVPDGDELRHSELPSYVSVSTDTDPAAS